MILDITDLGVNFEGVAKDNGKVYFVPFCLPSERVEAEIKQDKKNFAIADLKSVVQPSNERSNPFCPYFYSCGGCDIQHILYEKQLFYKTKLVKDTLKKVGEIDCNVLPTIPSTSTYFYRNKGAFPVGEKLGMFRKNSHDVVSVNQCMLMNNGVTTAYKIVKKYLEDNKIGAYNFEKHSGIVKSVVIRSIENQTLVCLVVANKFPCNNLFDNLKKEIENVGLYLNINRQHNSTILGRDFCFVDGIKTIKLREFDIDYEIDIASFLQVNTDIKHEIYGKVIEEIGGGIAIDAYAGAGLLSSMMSKKAEKVYSVELNTQASNSAQKLVEKNHIKNMEVINGDCAKVVPNLAKRINAPFSIVLDPARVGCSEKVVEVATLAQKIVYVSCNPIALSKDLKIMTKTHKIKYVQPFDMFPHTKHIETLVCLEKL